MGSKATATFTSPKTGDRHTLEMSGNWLDSTADVVDKKTGGVVARINRELLSGRELFFGKETYAVAVAPGVDKSLIAALCICLDQKNNKK